MTSEHSGRALRVKERGAWCRQARFGHGDGDTQAWGKTSGRKSRVSGAGTVDCADIPAMNDRLWGSR